MFNKQIQASHGLWIMLFGMLVIVLQPLFLRVKMCYPLHYLDGLHKFSRGRLILQGRWCPVLFGTSQDGLIAISQPELHQNAEQQFTMCILTQLACIHQQEADLQDWLTCMSADLTMRQCQLCMQRSVLLMCTEHALHHVVPVRQ